MTYRKPIFRSAALAAFVAYAATASWANASSVPAGCLQSTDPEPQTLLYATKPVVVITTFECPISDEDAGSYMAYRLEWTPSKKSYVYVPAEKESNDAVVGVIASLPGQNLVLIDEAAERGGTATLIWRVKDNQYTTHRFDYSGVDEGGLETLIKGNRVTVSFIYPKGRKQLVHGKPMHFRLDPAKGTISREK
jgi:hypothetical protein